MNNGYLKNQRGKIMEKFLFSSFLFLFSSSLFAFSDGSYVSISSNSFGNVSIDSATATLIPSTATSGIGGLSNTVIFSTNSMREIIYSNMSSSVTVFFSTSPLAGWTQDNGTPIFPQGQVSVDFDPTVSFSTNSANRFFFVRETGGNGGALTQIRVWVRNTFGGRSPL